MTNSLAYLKGALADGHVYDLKSRIRIVVRQKHSNWLNETIAPILREISKKEPKIIRTKDNNYMIYIYVHKSNMEKTTLDILTTSLSRIRFDDTNDELFFVRGFFDAEGSLYTNNKKKSDVRIIMYQKDKNVLLYIKDILRRFKITADIYGPYKNGKNSIFRLIIFTKPNVKSFLNKVGLFNESKYENWREYT